MKKILLLSDTHSYIDKQILRHVEEADEVWHAGDIGDISVTDQIKALKPLRAVYGNIDDHNTVRLEFPEVNTFFCEGVKVLMIHIGGYPKRYAKGVRDLLKAEKPKLFICGHSHILKVIYDKDLQLLHLNPGAIGTHGFHKVRTMLKFEIDRTEIKNMQIVEYER